jgi:hypothetical protein
MTFLLHVTYASGLRHTLTFPSAFARGLFVIALAQQPVGVTLEDRS